MIRANQLVERALRLINVPGRGSALAAEDLRDGVTSLQEILDSEAVSKQFVPGIRRHFFPMVQGQAIYSYGASPAANLRSDDFDGDPAPIRLEDVYIREGSVIVNNEQVGNYRFENQDSWTLSGTAAIANNRATIDGIGEVSQNLTLTVNTTYTLTFNVEIDAGGLLLRVDQNAAAILDLVIDSSGEYSLDFTFTDTLPVLRFITTSADDDVIVFDASIIERGKQRLELPDSQGSDYGMTIVDQIHYNRRFTKGTGGRPYEILYTRDWPISEIRFDNSAVVGDILVMDVLVNRVAVNDANSIIRLHPDAIRWLRYELADDLAGAYGKALTANQVIIKEDAWNKLSSGNRRINALGVDRGLRERPTFDINRGDP